MKKHVVVVGAGFVGLELATRPSELLAESVRITQIEKFGDGLVGKVDVNFLDGPAPMAHPVEPLHELAAEKRAFGAARRQSWFGLAMDRASVGSVTATSCR
jgi:NADH dehydrogenase FAD-containing subunit